MALACSRPADHGFAMTHWTLRTLCRASVAQGLVDELAPETARQWLQVADLRLHRYRSWLYSDDPLFDERLQDIVRLYTQPPAGSRVYCLDERTGMQALEYWAAETSAIPGRPGRREFHYTRHGTLTLFGCFEVHTGQAYGRCFKQHRGEDLLQFLYWLVPQLPRRQKLHFVLDNLATHKRRDVQDFIASFRGRIQLHFTPTHASWLNQIELWFGLLQQRVLKRGSFASLTDLDDKVMRFIDYYNAHEAHPYRWTFTGQPRAL
ncbi:MAG: IS630 family transposase [Armatimonadia bacterium]